MSRPELRWQQPPEHAELGTDETDVWAYAIGDPDIDNASIDRLLTADEQARAARILAGADRHRFIAGRVALRALLGRYLNIAPREVRLARDEHGKPRLDPGGPHADIRFNASGSGELVLIAVRRRHEVGVDVEKITDVDEAIATSAMTPLELAEWRTLTEPRRRARFHELWVGKEAVSKAVGVGLGMPLGDIALPPQLECVQAPASSGSKRPASPVWVTLLPAPRPGFAAALASVAPFTGVRLWSAAGNA